MNTECRLLLCCHVCCTYKLHQKFLHLFMQTDSWSSCDRLLLSSEMGIASHDNFSGKDVSFPLKHISLFPFSLHDFLAPLCASLVGGPNAKAKHKQRKHECKLRLGIAHLFQYFACLFNPPILAHYFANCLLYPSLSSLTWRKNWPFSTLKNATAVHSGSLRTVTEALKKPLTMDQAPSLQSQPVCFGNGGWNNSQLQQPWLK